jgi:hypothetical protein
VSTRAWRLGLLLAIFAGHWIHAVEPLPQAHAHNDYEHKRPLLDALDHGFCSVEADVYWTNGVLLVAHDADKVDTKRTLQALYLDPLRERVKNNGGRVYTNGPSLLLLIDFKTDAESTYAGLRPVLEAYRDILTKFTTTETRTGAVTVVLSGNRPTQTVAGERVRWVAIDGRLPDLDGNQSRHLLPLVSDNWTRHFQWRGEGALAESERVKLKALVDKAHAQRRKIRFWAVPDTEEGWRVMREAGVNLINTDNLAGLQRFLTAR